MLKYNLTPEQRKQAKNNRVSRSILLHDIEVLEFQKAHTPDLTEQQIAEMDARIAHKHERIAQKDQEHKALLDSVEKIEVARQPVVRKKVADMTPEEHEAHKARLAEAALKREAARAEKLANMSDEEREAMETAARLKAEAQAAKKKEANAKKAAKNKELKEQFKAYKAELEAKAKAAAADESQM